MILSGYTLYKLIAVRTTTAPWGYKDYISIIVIFFTVNTFISVLVMLIQCVYLISVNRTTNENIRGTKYPGDVFDEGCKANWKIFFSEN